MCVVELAIIGPDNSLSPGQCQAIIWTNAGILLIGPLETNFIEISIGIQTFSFKKMHLKLSSAKWRPFCLSLNVFTDTYYHSIVTDGNNETFMYCSGLSIILFVCFITHSYKQMFCHWIVAIWNH